MISCTRNKILDTLDVHLKKIKTLSNKINELQNAMVQHCDRDMFKTAAVPFPFTWHAAVPPSRRKYVKRVLGISNDCTNFPQHCTVDHFGQHWCR